MAHKFESGLFFGESAWHGLGITLPTDSPARQSVCDAITAAGMDWEVTTREIYTDMGGVKEIETHRAVVRETDNRILGVVKNRFQPLQNRDIFNWFQPFLDEGVCQFETCGSLKNGAVVWVLARVMMGEQEVKTGDLIRPYLLLASSHDSSLATHVGFNPIRVVCWNTLSAATRAEAGKLLRVKHTARQKIALTTIRETMDVVRGQFNATMEQYRTLARCGVSRVDIREYVRKVFEFADDETIKTRSKNTLDDIVKLCMEGAGNDGSSVWDAYNGVTQYLTHNHGRTAESRLEGLWFGNGKVRSDRAMNLAYELVR